MKLYIKPFYVRKPSMFKLVALLNTDNVSEMQKLAIFTYDTQRLFIQLNRISFIAQGYLSNETGPTTNIICLILHILY